MVEICQVCVKKNIHILILQRDSFGSHANTVKTVLSNLGLLYKGNCSIGLTV